MLRILSVIKIRCATSWNLWFSASFDPQGTLIMYAHQIRKQCRLLLRLYGTGHLDSFGRNPERKGLGVEGLWEWKSPFLHLLLRFPKIVIWRMGKHLPLGKSPTDRLPEGKVFNTVQQAAYSFPAPSSPHWTIHCCLHRPCALFPTPAYAVHFRRCAERVPSENPTSA